MALPDWVVIGGVIASALGSIGLAIRARPEARKMDRDGAAAALAAGAGIITANSASYTTLLEQVAELQAWRKQTERFGRVHLRWDDLIATKARAAGIEIPDPPPLYPDDED